MRLWGLPWMDVRQWRKPRELKPDIVIMDINLPKLNGLEAIRAIQETAAGRSSRFT